MPDAPRPRLVICNATPIIALALIGQLDLLIVRLQQGGIRLSDPLVERVLELAGEGRDD